MKGLTFLCILFYIPSVTGLFRSIKLTHKEKKRKEKKTPLLSQTYNMTYSLASEQRREKHRKDNNNSIKENMTLSPAPFASMVDEPAILSDLPLVSSERRNIPHFDHRLSKLLEEEVIVVRIRLDQLHRDRVLAEEDLIRAEKALAGYKVLEVVVVELGRANEVQREEVLVPTGTWTTSAQLGGIVVDQ